MDIDKISITRIFLAMAAMPTIGFAQDMPQPEEYVRTCEAFGRGYFYLPGSETCFRLSGNVRLDYRGGDLVDNFGGFDRNPNIPGFQNSLNDRARATLRLSTKADTELSELETFTEITFNYANGGIGSGNGTNFEAAWIRLGGLKVGKFDSLFTTLPLFAGEVVADDLIPFGSFGQNQVSYAYDAGNGLKLAGSLETGYGADAVDGHMPHLVAGGRYSKDQGAVTLVGAYNSVWEEWAAKVRGDIELGEKLILFAMAGYGSDDTIGKNFYKPWGGNWAAWGGATIKVHEKAPVNNQVSFDEDGNFGAALNVVYEPVTNLKITPEVAYLDNLDEPGGGWAGMLRFQRNF